MRVIIAGGREVSPIRAEALVTEALIASGWVEQVTQIVHGACPTGIDAAADAYCRGMWPIKTFPADWATHGKAAGPIRNKQMSEYADALILIWNGYSHGSANMLKQAEQANLKIFIHRY